LDINPTDDWTINTLELIKEKQDETSKQNLIYQKQAELRGSVGGVTSLLAIQASVVAGTTSYDSGVSMLKYIYGFDDSIAREILGQPTIPNVNTTN